MQRRRGWRKWILLLCAFASLQCYLPRSLRSGKIPERGCPSRSGRKGSRTHRVVVRHPLVSVTAAAGTAALRFGCGLAAPSLCVNPLAVVNTLTVNLDLVKKYNVAGPRYTSYPPATKFTDAVSWEQLSAKIEENNRAPRDLSVYFHIPFCETLCWFCGCTTVITLNHAQGMAYVEALGREVAKMAPMLNPQRKAVQLHFGGGSPTFLRPDEIRRLGEIIHKHFTFSPDIEASVEVDPRRLTREHMVALREIGFNRASMGVQDFNPKVQEAIHRIQPREMTQQAMDWMRELGYDSINLDLIYGLPFQTPESFNETLDTVLEMKPDRLAVFSYAHVPWIKPSQKILETKILPHAGKQTGSAQARHRTAHGGRPIRLYRHGPFCEADRRTRHRAAREKIAAEFSGLQHARRLGHLRVRHERRFADARCLLAERKGTAEMAGRRGRRQRAVAQGVFRDRRGQNPPRNHHARRCATSRSISPR